MRERGVTRKVSSVLSLFGLHRTPRLFLSLWRDRRVSWWLKTSSISGLIYVFSPLDVMPDISGVGLLDDILVALLIMQAFIELAPSDVVDEHCKRLRINPEQVFVDVPRTVKDAMELYSWATEKGFGGRGRQRGWRSYDDEAAGPEAPPFPHEPPPYSRYSAFSDEQE